MQEQLTHTTNHNVCATLEYCDNPAWYAVTALPPLSDISNKNATALMASLYANSVACDIVAQNPTIAHAVLQWSRSNSNSLQSQLEKNETLKQLLLSQTPWTLDATTNSRQLQQIATLLDSRRAAQLRHEAITLLSEMQNANGGWPWFKEMEPSFWMTLNILTGLSQLPQCDDTAITSTLTAMQQKALQYIDNQYVERNTKHIEQIDYYDICYLYVRSKYIQTPLDNRTQLVYRTQLDSLASQWHRLDYIEKAYAAMTFAREGRKEVASLILNSLREYATRTPEQGMFWANNRSSGYYHNSAIQVHCAIYDAFETIAPRREELDAMRQWLLLQKQTQSWGNTPSTLDATRILLTTGSNWLGNPNSPKTELQWGNTPLPPSSEIEQIMGYEKFVKQNSEVTPCDATIALTRHGEHPSWGAIYWQYDDTLSTIEAHGNNDIEVSRQYYVMRENRLQAIEHTALHMGDIVTVRLQFTTQRDMQYLTLTDSRPACFEPTQQLPQSHYGGNIWYYCVPSDAGTTFYIEHLPRGTYVIEYQVYVDRKGSYSASAATMQCYYAPQFTAHTAGAKVIVGNNP